MVNSMVTTIYCSILHHSNLLQFKSTDLKHYLQIETKNKAFWNYPGLMAALMPFASEKGCSDKVDNGDHWSDAINIRPHRCSRILCWEAQ